MTHADIYGALSWRSLFLCMRPHRGVAVNPRRKAGGNETYGPDETLSGGAGSRSARDASLAGTCARGHGWLEAARKIDAARRAVGARGDHLRVDRPDRERGLHRFQPAG